MSKREKLTIRFETVRYITDQNWERLLEKAERAGIPLEDIVGEALNKYVERANYQDVLRQALRGDLE